MDTINQLQDSLISNVTTNVTSTVNEQISNLLAQLFIPSIVVVSVILLFYIIRIIHRFRVDRAVFEIRDMLREMKAEQKNTPTGEHHTPAPVLEEEPADQDK